jgi:hypothetical protein
MRRIVVSLLAVLTTGCATLGPRTEGVTGAIAYQATDMEQRYNLYSFNVVIKETQGTAITFNEIHVKAYQPGLSPWTPRYRGTWTLPANGQFRIPLSVRVTCTGSQCQSTNMNPLWQITMTGTSERGQPIRAVIDLRLPGDPPVPPVATSKDVPAITLTTPPGGSARQ